tara:strand:- start:253 stop:966 length:714 start_codon:yes stop_codon:yes gene_type:complete
MSATIKEISYNILNSLRGGRSNNNEHISLKQVEFNIKHYRAMLIRRDFQRNGKITRHFEQDLGCIPLTVVNASMCCGLPLDCTVVRTTQKIPRTVRYNFMDAITHISDPTGLNTIPLIDSIAVQFLPFDRFTKNDRKAYMIEDYLYIYNPDGMDMVNVRGVLENPEEAANFDCDGSDCYDDTMAYPVSLDLVNAITDGLLQGTFMLLPRTTSDTEDDTMQAGHVPAPKQQARGKRPA